MLDSESFIHCLKHFTAWHGRPHVIYSDNGGTFIKTRKWIQQLQKDERVQGLLEKYEIMWKFNLSRALVVGRSIRETDQSRESLYVQGHWGSKVILEGVEQSTTRY